MGDKKYVYFFGGGKAEGRADMKDILGGKGANLAEMTNLGIPVPPGFTISAEVCDYYYKHGEKYPEGLEEEVESHLKRLEETTGKKFGDKENPLLVSVRSGAAISMPGMMDTVLNLGLNDEVVEGVARLTNNERFAWDSYRRFIQMFGNVVMGIDHDKFEKVLEAQKKKKGVTLDTELDTDDLKEVVKQYKKLYKEETGEDFPQEPKEQLWKAINAVFGSWNNERAIKYREINEIKGLLGTAVNVQTMVFGNMGNDSGTGVAFSRNPSTGEKKFYGEFLMNAQGEDVVAGIRTPETLEDMKRDMPEIYEQLSEIKDKLEKHYKDMQDMEFTIEKGKLYMLQTRTGKRTAQAAVKIAVDMVKEGLIDKETAIMRVSPNQLDQLLHPMIDPKAKVEVIAKGLPASPGAAVGQIVFTAQEAEEEAAKGKDVILVRVETSPEDIGGMNAAQGILTARGGMTSHAAVVARGMGKCCVVGCSDVHIMNENECEISGIKFKKGDWITLNGTTGDVIKGKVELVEPEPTGDFAELMQWADDIRRLRVRTNADTPKDAKNARRLGAEGIGLCRTEHMFFEGNRIDAVREMILAEDVEGRKKALAKLLPMQQGDFEGIFEEMDGLPVTIRLLDPPLHEFLPKKNDEIEALAKDMGVSVETLKKKVESLTEFNPMLGHRGCRLGITYPEIYEMQVEAIIRAACNMKKKGVVVEPEIMIPLVGTVKELSILRDLTEKTADRVIKEEGAEVKYLVGTMIEIPRAALVADKIAEVGEFFSFGTNDLTQMTFGYSRDDAGVFLPEYINKGILEKDPFQVLDQEGVGQLIQMGIERGRKTRPRLKVGICGEHGGEPSSVEFCHRVGMDYVSCSPFRVPIARLAAAQAVVREKQSK
ncbi:MAG: pyruvate, phosphate dikinase [Spirochaetes bacterium]|nr:MAG: pyruvate, phosphate dikinase [Spirochaetota bacterium]